MKQHIPHSHFPSARSRAFSATAAVLAGLAALTVGVSPAAATAKPWAPYHAEWGPDDWVDFCDVPGLTITEEGQSDGLSRTVIRGPDDLPHERSRERFTDTYTNPATGEFVFQSGKWHGGDHLATLNGDGTLTLISRYVRNETFTKDGEVIGRETGLFGFTSLWDTAGTPTDRSDDEFITQVGDSINRGRNVDFCSMMVEALG